MPIDKIIYSNNLLKFSEAHDISIDLKSGSSSEERKSIKANLFNWNSTYNIEYYGNGEFKILSKVSDSPDLIENEEYVIFYL